MKKLSLLFAAASVLFFASCEEQEQELTSLEGTTWKFGAEYDGGWIECKLTFTATHATYSETNGHNTNRKFTGTYTFDPPTIVIVSDHWTFWGETPERTTEMAGHHEGTVNRKTMTIGIQYTHDLFGITELKRQ